MSRVPDTRRAIRGLGLAAAAMLVLMAATRAEALSLINPGAAPAAKYASDGLKTEVRGGHGHGGGFRGGGFRGGGAAFHGGGFRGGGAAFRGGGYRIAPAFHRGGGYRYASPGIVRHHIGPRRVHFHHRHHIRPRYYGYAPVYYPQRHYYPRRFCKVVWTYYGPRKICRYRPWHNHLGYGLRYW
ncbi:MAG: hypothetical protein Q7U92_10230 [Bradyrhizobium sp.]|nr:hypothetical protein [Bradyrhizobium sp.]